MSNVCISPKAACWATVRAAERSALTGAALERSRHDLDAQEAEAVATRHADARRAQREAQVAARV